MLQAGYYTSLADPDAGPSATVWRIQRWESVQKPVVIHALLDSAGSPPAMMTTWTAVVNNTINKGVLSNGQTTNQQQKKKRDHPMNPRAIAKASFSSHGGEVLNSNFWWWSSFIFRFGLDTYWHRLSPDDVITFSNSSLLTCKLCVAWSQIWYMYAPHCEDSASHCIYPLNMGSSFS